MRIYTYTCGNTAYHAIEPLKITAREIPSPRQPYKFHISAFKPSWPIHILPALIVNILSSLKLKVIILI